MTTNSEGGDDGEENSNKMDPREYRAGELSGDGGGFEKQLREDSDEELNKTMDRAFSEPVPRSRDHVASREELAAEGDESAEKALQEHYQDDLEKRLEDASPEELMKTLVREVQANREALERLADDEGEKGTPWTL